MTSAPSPGGSSRHRWSPIAEPVDAERAERLVRTLVEQVVDERGRAGARMRLMEQGLFLLVCLLDEEGFYDSGSGGDKWMSRARKELDGPRRFTRGRPREIERAL